MKVKELIEQLGEFDPEQTIMLRDDSGLLNELFDVYNTTWSTDANGRKIVVIT